MLYFGFREFKDMSAFDRLISQIDAFIRKFYKNQIIKGLLLFIGVLVVSYLLVISLEHFGRFNSVIRGALLFGFLGVNFYILSKYIIGPSLKLKSFGGRINRYQASQIIGKFFPTISDRLLNTLQLKDQMNENSADFELLNASVQQRSSSMSAIPFADAIDLGENRKHLTWVLPVVIVLFTIGVLSPSFLSQGTKRVINFTETYEVPAPFKFNLLSKNNTIEEGEDYNFELQLSGNSLPEKVYIKSSQGRFLLTRTAKNKFEGELDQLRESTKFHFEANGFNSQTYNVNVISKTSINKFQATLLYPKYLGLTNEKLENAGDLSIPEGTEVVWSVLTKNSEGVEFWVNTSKKKFSKDGFSMSSKFTENADAKVVLTNKFNKKKDTTFFHIDVVKDEFPTIITEEVKDTLKEGLRYFSGMVADDHGLGSLTFVYKITSSNGEARTERMNVSRVFGNESPFNFAVDFRREKLSLEDNIEYYFVVSDNDGVNGPKTSSSRKYQYKLPSLEELNDVRDEEQEEIKNDLNSILNQADKFKKDLEKLRKETQNSKQSDWDKQNQVEQLQEDHESLIENLEKLQDEMQNSVEEKNQLSELDKELLEQQELINKLLEELMDDEMRDLLKQLEELMEKQDKNAIEENMEELEMSADDMKNQLDRSLEALKRLQVNEKIDDIEEELEKLAKEQDELRNETKDKKDISDEDVKKQDDINDKFDQLKDDMKKLDSLNNALDKPMGLDDQDELKKEIDEDLDESKDKLEKDKGEKASENQKGASDKMKQMAENLDNMQAESNKKQQQEDMDLLRDILESLITLSFDQEDIMKKFIKVKEADPAYREYGRKQRKIVDDTKVVRDSLYALAERQPKIAQFIDKELNQIKSNHGLILEDIDERRQKDLSVHQQFVMTSYNNLALMLNESLQQMQEQMQNMSPGSGSCNKPGGKGKPKSGSEPSPGDMKEMLKQQLEQMKEKGPNPGGEKPGDKPGDKPGNGASGMGLGNKEVAKMAAQQSAIRKKLEQMRSEMNKDGKGKGNKLNPLIEELEQQEKDLVNKRLGDNLVERQQRILTRLLESEKALMERGLDEKRESKEGKSTEYGNQIRFDEYNMEKLKQIELLRSVDPSYKKYYKDRANEYFNRAL